MASVLAPGLQRCNQAFDLPLVPDMRSSSGRTLRRTNANESLHPATERCTQTARTVACSCILWFTGPDVTVNIEAWAR